MAMPMRGAGGSTADPGRYFVTGGAGNIGSHLVDRLLTEGHQVTVYDNLTSGNRAWIAHNLDTKDFRFIEADLLDVAQLRRAVVGHELIFHLGANTDIPSGYKNSELDLQHCTIATHNVLEAMRTTGIKKLVFSSTSAVYGEPSVSPTPESYGPLRPISLYGGAKLGNEGQISAYCHLFGMQAWIFRFANVVSGRMGHGVIYDFIEKLRRDPHELEIWGDGEQEKSYFLAEDCIDGILCAQRNSREWCDVFNLGSPSRTQGEQDRGDRHRGDGAERGAAEVHGRQAGLPGGCAVAPP